MRHLSLLAALGLFVITPYSFAGCHTSHHGCADQLSCVEPITRMSCTDQYCFKPPKGAISQAECCESFGNIGHREIEDT